MNSRERGHPNLNPSARAVCATLETADCPLSADEIAHQTGYSTSTIRDAIGVLRETHDVRDLPSPEEGRRLLYWLPAAETPLSPTTP